jgi:hypothetical protein
VSPKCAGRRGDGITTEIQLNQRFSSFCERFSPPSCETYAGGTKDELPVTCHSHILRLRDPKNEIAWRGVRGAARAVDHASRETQGSKGHRTWINDDLAAKLVPARVKSGGFLRKKFVIGFIRLLRATEDSP